MSNVGYGVSPYGVNPYGDPRYIPAPVDEGEIMVDVPHFDFPFRLTGHSFTAVEQDSYEDIFNCVEVIMITPLGFRNDAPEFGVSGLLFVTQPIGKELIEDMITSQEPRAEIIVQEAPDKLDALIDRISIDVGTTGD